MCLSLERECNYVCVCVFNNLFVSKKIKKNKKIKSKGDKPPKGITA